MAFVEGRVGRLGVVSGAFVLVALCSSESHAAGGVLDSAVSTVTAMLLEQSAPSAGAQPTQTPARRRLDTDSPWPMAPRVHLPAPLRPIALDLQYPWPETAHAQAAMQVQGSQAREQRELDNTNPWPTAAYPPVVAPPAPSVPTRRFESVDAEPSAPTQPQQKVPTGSFPLLP
jgi:hypothetical protein